VLSPVLIPVLICATAVMAVVRIDRGKRLEITPARVWIVVLGGSLALYVFVSDSLRALLQGKPDWTMLRPGPFRWPLFLVALAWMALPSLITVWPGRGSIRGGVGSIWNRYRSKKTNDKTHHEWCDV
jgi:hypothetical protein